MNTHKFLILVLLPFLILSCTKSENSAKPTAVVQSPADPTKTEAPQDQIEKDLLAEQTKRPPVIDNDPSTSQDPDGAFKFSNEAQRFTLTKLGHLVDSEFRCKATLKVAHLEKEEQGTIKLSFSKNDLGQNEFKATWWPLASGQKPFYIANKKEICGEKIQAGNTKKAIGSLAKIQSKIANNTTSQYVLQYTVYTIDPVSLKLKWPESGTKPGEMICETLSRQAIAKAKIENCELVALK